jgi:redox-sensitive bicupin YhaK (pirin superfamily)
VVAGEYRGVHGPVTEIAAQPLYLEIQLAPGVEFCQDIPAGHFAIAYLFEGEAHFGLDASGSGEQLQALRMIVLDDGDHLWVQAGADKGARFMLMAGVPFGEPIAPYGPFVMNTMEEIQQALNDLRNGTFVR